MNSVKIKVKDYFWFNLCHYSDDIMIHSVNILPSHHVRIITELVNYMIIHLYQNLITKVKLYVKLNSCKERVTPMRPAMANKCITKLVEPPTAVFVMIMLHSLNLTFFTMVAM